MVQLRIKMINVKLSLYNIVHSFGPQTYHGAALYLHIFFFFQSNYSLVRKACNIWRNFWDISDNWNSIQGYITFYGKNNELFQKYTGPGGFFDPDMVNIGITHVFSCINICLVTRKLIEHEAVRPSVQTSSEGPGKC